MEWANVDYNLGNTFDGTYFTVPENGLYSFYACCSPASSSHGYIYLFLNHKSNIEVFKVESNSSKTGKSVNFNTTLKLVKNDKVDVRFDGNFVHTKETTITYFEGRMIARIDE